MEFGSDCVLEDSSSDCVQTAERGEMKQTGGKRGERLSQSPLSFSWGAIQRLQLLA